MNFVNEDSEGLKKKRLTSWTIEQMDFDQSGRVVRTTTKPNLVERFTLNQMEQLEQIQSVGNHFGKTIKVYHKQ